MSSSSRAEVSERLEDEEKREMGGAEEEEEDSVTSADAERGCGVGEGEAEGEAEGEGRVRGAWLPPGVPPAVPVVLMDVASRDVASREVASREVSMSPEGPESSEKESSDMVEVTETTEERREDPRLLRSEFVWLSIWGIKMLRSRVSFRLEGTSWGKWGDLARDMARVVFLCLSRDSLSEREGEVVAVVRAGVGVGEEEVGEEEVVVVAARRASEEIWKEVPRDRAEVPMVRSKEDFLAEERNDFSERSCLMERGVGEGEGEWAEWEWAEDGGEDGGVREVAVMMLRNASKSWLEDERSSSSEFGKGAVLGLSSESEEEERTPVISDSVTSTSTAVEWAWVEEVVVESAVRSALFSAWSSVTVVVRVCICLLAAASAVRASSNSIMGWGEG